MSDRWNNSGKEYQPYTVKASINSGISPSPNSNSETGFIAFHTASSTVLDERMRIEHNGNVGIGTTSPLDQLHVYKAGTDQAWKGRGIFGNETCAFVCGVYNNKVHLGGHNGALNAWYDIAINPSPGANVGIGTTSPANKLHVHSTDNVANYAVPQVLITADPASSYNQWASLELRGAYIGNTVTYGVGIRSTYGWDSNNRYYGDFNIYTSDKNNGNARTDRLRVTSEGNTEVNGNLSVLGDLSVLGGGVIVKGGGLYDFTSHTFTPCGKTGRLGPSLSAVSYTHLTLPTKA